MSNITLILENGTGVVGANAYVTAAYVSAFATLNGNTLWCDNVSQQNLAIAAASEFLDLRYSTRFCGDLVNPLQGLQFPRSITDPFTLVVTQSGIPNALQKAVATLALQFLNGGLDLNANSDSDIASEEVTLGKGAIIEKTTYFKHQYVTAFSNFAAADRYITQVMQAFGCESTGSNKFFIPAYRG